jgi:hypothetical protein
MNNKAVAEHSTSGNHPGAQLAHNGVLSKVIQAMVAARLSTAAKEGCGTLPLS